MNYEIVAQYLFFYIVKTESWAFSLKIGAEGSCVENSAHQFKRKPKFEETLFSNAKLNIEKINSENIIEKNVKKALWDIVDYNFPSQVFTFYQDLWEDQKRVLIGDKILEEWKDGWVEKQEEWLDFSDLSDDDFKFIELEVVYNELKQEMSKQRNIWKIHFKLPNVSEFLSSNGEEKKRIEAYCLEKRIGLNSYNNISPVFAENKIWNKFEDMLNANIQIRKKEGEFKQLTKLDSRWSFIYFYIDPSEVWNETDKLSFQVVLDFVYKVGSKQERIIDTIEEMLNGNKETDEIISEIKFFTSVIQEYRSALMEEIEVFNWIYNEWSELDNEKVKLMKANWYAEEEVKKLFKKLLNEFEWTDSIEHFFGNSEWWTEDLKKYLELKKVFKEFTEKKWYYNWEIWKLVEAISLAEWNEEKELLYFKKKTSYEVKDFKGFWMTVLLSNETLNKRVSSVVNVVLSSNLWDEFLALKNIDWVKTELSELIFKDVYERVKKSKHLEVESYWENFSFSLKWNFFKDFANFNKLIPVIIEEDSWKAVEKLKELWIEIDVKEFKLFLEKIEEFIETKEMVNNIYYKIKEDNSEVVLMIENYMYAIFWNKMISKVGWLMELVKVLSSIGFKKSDILNNYTFSKDDFVKKYGK